MDRYRSGGTGHQANAIAGLSSFLERDL